VQARRHAVATAQPARGTPVVKLEDYRQSSQQAPPPQDDGDDSSDDDGSDYTRFYRHFGM
jgi:hypothetical protein